MQPRINSEFVGECNQRLTQTITSVGSYYNGLW